MTLKHVFILSIVFSLCSCYNIKPPEKPENLISKEKFAIILMDAALMHSAKSVNRKRIETNGIVPEDYIYKKHNIDSLAFAKANEYYAYDINVYDEIYNKVNDSLNKLKEKYNAILIKEKNEKMKKDSLKKLKNKKKTPKIQKIKTDTLKTDNSHEY